MIPNQNPHLAAVYERTDQQGARVRIHLPVVAWDHGGRALVPAHDGRLHPAMDHPHGYELVCMAGFISKRVEQCADCGRWPRLCRCDR